MRDMKQRLNNSWQKLPSSVRKPLVLVFGSLLIIAAGLTGWLPGPGGIPLFLLGVAVLATEFVWAKVLLDLILKWVKAIGSWIQQNPLLGGLVIMAIIFGLIGFALAVGRLFSPYVYH